MTWTTSPRARTVAAAAVLLLLPAAVPGGILEEGLPGTARALSVVNLFANSEMEACAPEAVDAGDHGRTACAPWLLRAAPPGEDDPGAHSSERPLYVDGHGSTTSLRVSYDARDGDAFLGQFTGVDDDVTATPWRAPQQVTLDVRVDGPAGLGVVADARYPDGTRALVPADPAPLVLPAATGWERVTFHFHGLGGVDGDRAAVTSVWLVVHEAFTADGVNVDVDNVYATNVFLEPYVAP